MSGLTEAQHTPGPWEVFATRRISAPTKGFMTVANVSVGQSRSKTGTLTIGPDEAAANARLIAAAPELLAALTALYEATPDNEGGPLGHACMQARAVLAKAAGRSALSTAIHGGGK